MKMPWTKTAHSDAERAEAEARYQGARSHLSILLRELEQTLHRIEDKQRRGIPE